MPRDTSYSGVAAIFRSALEHGRSPRVFEDGGQRRDFLHVHDVAQANLLALAAAGGIYNIASREPRPILAMAEALAAAVGGPAPAGPGQFPARHVPHLVGSPRPAPRG